MSDSDSDSNSPHISHKNSSEIAADIGQFLRQRQDNGKKGRKSKANINNNDGPLAPFIKVARWIPLAIDPFINLHDVFMMGLQGWSGQRERMTVDEQYKCIVFENIVPLMPDLVSIISEFSKDAKTFQAMVTQMTKAVAGIRSSDAMTFKRSMSTYIVPNEESKVQYLIPNFGQKQLWGWNHRVTRRFMCPMRLLSKFDANPQEFLDRASDYPMFLYDESKYDPRNVYSGLFQGQLLLKFYRHVFTGPSSWNNGKSSGGKKPWGLVNRLEEPTARTITYVAVMVRWALSASKDFCTNDDNSFNLVDLYHNILIAFNERIDYKGDVVLEKSTQEWIEATLRWWKM
ncbi:hypothetical protein APHAL10511_000250 [Amanita phalloides]|nr:hypothetical protein APHAL10511_000250 [Amanita phalloides]